MRPLPVGKRLGAVCVVALVVVIVRVIIWSPSLSPETISVVVSFAMPIVTGLLIGVAEAMTPCVPVAFSSGTSNIST